MLQHEKYPKGLNLQQKVVFIHKVGPCSLQNGILFKLSLDQKLKRSLEPNQVPKVIFALHLEEAGVHFAENTTVQKIKNASYWWPTMYMNTHHFIKNCHPRQRTGAPTATSHWPRTPILPLAPFEKLGIAYIGPIKPAARSF
jgi:hypothetical protein